MNFGDSLSCFIIQKTSTRHSSCMNTCLLPEELEGFLAIFVVSFRFFFFNLFMFLSAIVDREPQISVVASCITHVHQCSLTQTALSIASNTAGTLLNFAHVGFDVRFNDFAHVCVKFVSVVINACCCISIFCCIPCPHPLELPR